MKTVMVTGPGQTAIVEVPRPEIGPADVLVRMRASGICGSDSLYISVGGIPPRQGATPLGHEPAGEIAEVGADVTGLTVGDHVVLNPMAAEDGIIGSGGAQGGLSEYVLIRGAQIGKHLLTVPDHIPFEVAALNEPMAVATHAVNRLEPKPGQKAVVFGAGPIGLGAAIGLKLRGAAHVTVVDVVPNRLAKALKVGADAVIDSSQEDVATRLLELHGEAPRYFGRHGKPATDLYLDAAGATAVIDTILATAKHGARLSIVAVHKKPVSVDFGPLLTSELTIALAMGYPTEIFEVTKDLIEHWEKYALIISDVLPYDQVEKALTLAATPGAADKVVVTIP
ncbi:zinc-dependent alcohol dehydrogenase [Actinoplanes derwentensis]|uniref:2-desacetyl-2-hydroxyethyl bacteriochlorophyllide A dehydrogenase n=1 Tax=Actinoplanes derwentensis TaxID=113562 RepID=A0A1H1T5V1_9ACTN|nr:zinc-binding dehydrogenase [Actinoplanes derwentensis]SDS55029.1 2-desacetyl-2-hydroxyethyl bacteriochlorophyllide A dehydrogenase [Actinoplanes derwentensis]